MAERKPCRCLLAEAAPDLERIVAEYVESLPEAARAPEKIYRARLAACADCDRLADGMCMDCGCYVEARAAKAGLKCPGVPSRWGRVQGIESE